MLRSAVEQADPVPDGVVEMARRAHSWDTDLVELVLSYDSAQLAGSALRSAMDVRDLSFTSGEVELELTFEDGAVSGLITPVSAVVELRVPGQDPQIVQVDESGRFTVAGTASTGAFVVTSGGETFRTELIDFL